MSNSPNRRSARRVPARPSAKVTCRAGALDLGPNLALVASDVAEGGVRLTLAEEVPKGRGVVVTLQGPGTGFRVTRAGRVAWCVPTEGGFEVGVVFDKPIAHADLYHLARV